MCYAGAGAVSAISYHPLRIFIYNIGRMSSLRMCKLNMPYTHMRTCTCTCTCNMHMYMCGRSLPEALPSNGNRLSGDTSRPGGSLGLKPDLGGGSRAKSPKTCPGKF